MPQLSTYNDFVYESTKIILNCVMANKISLDDAGAIFYFIEKSENIENLREVLNILKEDYPVIDEIFIMEKSQIKISAEDLVSKFISHIIKDNPLLAAEISSAACKPNVTIEELKSRYPLFADYLA